VLLKQNYINLIRYHVLKLIFRLLLVFLISGLSCNFPGTAEAQSHYVSEYQIKAGLIYKFFEYVEWPEEAYPVSGQFVTIGIIGTNPFGQSFREVEGLPVNGRKLVVKYFNSDATFEELQECQVLFITPSLGGARTLEIISALKASPVLTISDSVRFVQKGGMINFVSRDGKVNFEINKSAAERTGIKIRSKLLRVSIRVITDNNTSPNN